MDRPANSEIDLARDLVAEQAFVTQTIYRLLTIWGVAGRTQARNLDSRDRTVERDPKGKNPLSPSPSCEAGDRHCCCGRLALLSVAAPARDRSPRALHPIRFLRSFQMLK